MHITFELAPIAKVGGLGDMVEGLTDELSKLGNQVEIVLPGFDFLMKDSLLKKEKIDQFSIIYDNKKETISIYQLFNQNLPIYLLVPNKKNHYFSDGTIYGKIHNVNRYIYYSWIAYNFIKRKRKKPDVIHVHDWHEAFLTFIKTSLPKEKFPPIVFTIHNTMYQGECSLEDLQKVPLDSTKKLEKKQHNLLKMGIENCDALTTVSKTFAKEILHNQSSFGLSPILRKYRRKLTGILNGINNDLWDPKTDPFIFDHYTSQESIESINQAKDKNRKILQKEYSLKTSSAPLVVSIGRLVQQKGPHLIKEALQKTLELKGQFILLGVPDNEARKKEFMDLQKSYKNDSNVTCIFEFNEKLSHLLYAAADFIIVPSIFEPCGLTQLIAFRYGTIPIVRKTGGLADTVIDVTAWNFSTKTGYTFTNPSEESLSKTLERALKDFKNKKKRINELRKTIMNLDYSWKKSTEKYLSIYHDLVQ
jgi:starch synthase